MRDQMQARLEALRKEFEAGQAELEQVEKRRAHLRDTMLRISGAIQVLEELSADGQATGHNGAGPDAPRPAAAQAGRPAGTQAEV